MGSRESAASYLSDDLIVEILSRLPARSVLRFKGVSRYWRDLISHPDHHRKFAQTVSGFFYYTVTAASSHRQQRICASFVAMGAMADGQQQPPLPMQIDPAFLPGMELLDSCNGLLLLRGYRSSPLPAAGYFYVVCNPTTRQWAELPQPSHPPGEFGGRRPLYYYYDQQEKSRTRSAALAFDPAVSSHFHVFQLVEKDSVAHHFVEAVEIYSSETGRWDLRNSGWAGGSVAYTGGNNFAFLNGAIYFCAGLGAVASVDTAGQAWGLTRVVPPFRASLGEAGGFVGQSQGRLLFVDVPDYARHLHVYALESPAAGDGGGDQRWTLVHRSDGQYFGKQLTVVAVHQDCKRVFLFDRVRWKLMAYDMDRRPARVACEFTRALGSFSCYPFFPYVPLSSPQAASLQS